MKSAMSPTVSIACRPDYSNRNGAWLTWLTMTRFTGLPNRLLINDRLDKELLRVQRNGHGLALLFLDLDGFKPVNDQHGHQIGDQLLNQVARRLEQCVRGSTPSPGSAVMNS